MKLGNQKLKTLYVMEYLKCYTDAERGASTADLIGFLASKGISAERKSLYSDIELLREYGLDIEMTRGKRTEYRLLNREFQLPELKLLVDVVGASRFITRKKSLELIEKLEDLASEGEARELRRSVYVDKRVKSMNESIYYSVDAIHAAINSDRKISFRYFNYTRDKKREFRHGGERYIVSPVSLTYSDENYYLYAYSAPDEDIRTYRVDRMVDVERMEEPRDRNELIRSFNPAVFANRMFAMFGGELTTVRLRFDSSLSTVVLDRFGSGVTLVPDGEDGFTVSVDVLVSPTFLSWVFSFGDKVKVLSPDNVVTRLTDMAKSVLAQYE